MRNQRAVQWQDITAKRDLLIITLVGVTCFIVAKSVNAFEMVYAATRPFEEWPFDFDEFVVVGFILSIAFAVFAYRRWRELAHEIQERIQIQIELQNAYAQLHDVITQRQVSEARRQEEEKVALQREAVLTATLAERARLARELHDTLAQGLAGVAFQLEGVATLFTSSPTAAQQQLDLAIRMVRNGVEEARRAIWDMHPQVFDRGSLTTALAEIVEQLPTDVTVPVEIYGFPKALPQAIAHHLLRIAHEALYNAAQHAQANHIEATLRFMPHAILLRVQDNGCGFEVQHVPSAHQGHFGLMGMRERAKEIGGQLQIQSIPVGGTTVEITVPFP